MTDYNSEEAAEIRRRFEDFKKSAPRADVDAMRRKLEKMKDNGKRRHFLRMWRSK